MKNTHMVRFEIDNCLMMTEEKCFCLGARLGVDHVGSEVSHSIYRQHKQAKKAGPKTKNLISKTNLKLKQVCVRGCA